MVRHPEEKDRHRVHTQTGDWTASVLYLPNGDELVFQKNQMLELEISAPGYANARIKYLIRKRRNLVPVMLEKTDLLLGDPEDPVIPFGRSVPIDK